MGVSGEDRRLVFPLWNLSTSRETACQTRAGNLLWKLPLLPQKFLTKVNGLCGLNKEIKEE